MKFPQSLSKYSSGSVLIEIGVAVVVLITLSSAILDIVNVLRAKTSLQEIAFHSAGLYSKLGKVSDASLTGTYSTINQDAAALRNAETAFKALFPGSKFTCGTASGPNCAKIIVSQPAANLMRVWVSLDVPTILFGGTSKYFNVATAETRIIEITKVPTQMVDFDFAFIDDVDDF